MLRRPLGLSQATLARPSHCGHTLWAYVQVITALGGRYSTKLLFFSLFVKNAHLRLVTSLTASIARVVACAPPTANAHTRENLRIQPHTLVVAFYPDVGHMLMI